MPETTETTATATTEASAGTTPLADVFGGKLEEIKTAKASESETSAAQEPEKKPSTEKVTSKETPFDLSDKPKVEVEKPLIDEVDAVLADTSAKGNVGMFRKLLTKAQARVKELEAAVTTQKHVDTSALDEQIKTLREQIAERDGKLERIGFEHSPKYQALSNSAKAEIEAAKSYIEGLEVDPSVIESAANAKGAKRVEILRNADIGPETIALISGHLAQLDSIARQRSEVETDWKKHSEQWKQEEVAATEAAQKRATENANRIFEKVGKTLSTLAPFKRVEGNEEWNGGVDARLAAARKVYDGDATQEEAASIINKGVAFDVVYETLEKRGEQLAEARKEIERLKGASPSVGIPRSRADGARGDLGDQFAERAARVI